MAHRLSKWVILQRADLQEWVVEGSQLLVRLAKEFFPRHMGGDLASALKTTRVCLSLFCNMVVCYLFNRGQKLCQDFVSC